MSIEPYWTDGQATIYLGDCREVLPTLPKVDLVLTDPPYNISQDGNGLRRLNYGAWDHQLGKEGDWFNNIEPKIKQTAILFCGKLQFSDMTKRFDASGYLTRALIWHKPNPTVLNCSRIYIEAVEFMVYAKKRGAYYAPTYKHNVFQYPAPVHRQHPTQKPVALCQELMLDCSRQSDTILDPFMGSGTTLVAAKQLGRKSIGVELEERYCEIAVKRLLQRELFPS